MSLFESFKEHKVKNKKQKKLKKLQNDVRQSKHDEVKDELEYAINWQRAFNQIYRDIKWCNAYACLNELACQKVLKEFMDSHFMFSDNVIDKSLQNILKQ